MEFTYKVEVNNCNSPKITCEIVGQPSKSAKFLAENLSRAFRDVRVICEQTGEIVYSFYYNDDFKKSTMSQIDCLATICQIVQ